MSLSSHHAWSRNGISAERHLYLGPDGAGECDGVDPLESGYIGRVAQDTNLEGGSVAGAAGGDPERELHRVHGVDRGVDARQHDALVVAIGAGGGGVIPIETLGSAGGMVVRAAAAHIGVAAVAGAVVQAAPAGDKGRPCGAGTGAVAFQIVVPRQRVNQAAAGAEGDCGAKVRIGALGSQPE